MIETGIGLYLSNKIRYKGDKRMNSDDQMTSPYNPDVGADIPVYSGDAFLSLEESQTEVRIRSRISFSPRPRMIVTMEGDYSAEMFKASIKGELADYELHIPASNEFYSLTEKNSTFGEKLNATFFGQGCLHDKANVLVDSVRFHLTNFPDFFWRSAGRGEQPNLEVTIGPWKLRIDRSQRTGKERDLAESERSYLLSNVCELRKSDGQAFSPSDYRLVEEFLSHIFSFLSGGFCGPLLAEGLDKSNAVTWRNQRPIMLSRARPSFNWFPRPFPEEIGKLIQSAWARWQNPVQQEALRRAIDWYRQIADTEIIAETHIILCQTTLELLSHIILSEESDQQLRAQFQTLRSTRTRIELLVDCLKAKQEIPPHYSELIQTASQHRWNSAAAALTGIRNNIIHPQLQSRQIYISIDLDSKIQICRWCIRLAELSILYMLGYNGRYDSRIATDGMGFPFVPWVDPSQAGLGTVA